MFEDDLPHFGCRKRCAERVPKVAPFGIIVEVILGSGGTQEQKKATERPREAAWVTSREFPALHPGEKVLPFLL